MEKGKQTTLLVGASLALIMGGCRTNHPEPQRPPVVAPTAVTLATSIVDANTGSAVTSNAVTLTIYTSTGTSPVAGPLTNSNGFFTYVPPSNATYPATYRMVVAGTGYETNTGYATINSTDVKTDGTGKVTYSARLTLRSTPPSGVTVATGTGTVSGGATTAPITSSAGSGNTGGSTVTVPAGTVPKTATGGALNGNATLQVVYSSNATTGSLSAFPGGFQVYENTSGTPQTTPQAIVSGGAISARMIDANGNEAKTFSSPVTVAVNVPAKTWNAEAGRIIAAGDQIPVWYYGDDGLMHVLKTSGGAIIKGTVGTANGDGTWPVTFSTDHFTFFNLAWISTTSNMYASVPVRITGAAGQPVGIAGIISNGGWYSAFGLTGGDPDPSNVTLANVPKGVTTGAATDLSTYTFVAGMAGGFKTFTVTAAQMAAATTSSPLIFDVSSIATATASCNVSVNMVCASNGLASAVPSALVTATATGDPIAHAVLTNVDGKATLTGLVPGKTYTIIASYYSPTYGQLLPITNTKTIDAGVNTTTFTFTVNCSSTGLTGAGS